MINNSALGDKVFFLRVEAELRTSRNIYETSVNIIVHYILTID